MRTGVVLDKLELITLSNGGRIELAVGDNNVVLVGPLVLGHGRPRAAPDTSARELRRARQRGWYARRAERKEMEKRVLKAPSPTGLLTTEQVATRLGLSAKRVGQGAAKEGLRVAKKEKSTNPTGYTLRFSWPDVEKWRAGVRKRTYKTRR